MTLRASDTCAPTCELLADSIERTAILVIALRRLAWAHHRTHSTVHGLTWPACADHFCRMAHDAIEGKLALGNLTASGHIVALVPAKEA
jgi:hypothetical protein